MTGDPSPLHVVFAPLLRHRNALVSDVLEAIQEREPAYRFADRCAELAWTREVGDMVDLVLAAVPRGRAGLTPTEAAAVRATGRARADQSIPLRAMLGAVREARRVVMASVYRIALTAEREITSDTLSHIDQLVGGFAGDIEDNLHEGWLARTNEIAASAEQAVAERVDRLLSDSDEACTAAAAELAEQGWDFFGGYALVMGEASSDMDAVEKELRSLLPSVLTARRTRPVPHVAVVLPASGEGDRHILGGAVRALAESHDATLLIAWPCRDPHELRDRYLAAIPLLGSLGRFGAGDPMVDARSLAVAQVVASSSVAARRVLERDVYEVIASDSDGADAAGSQLTEVLAALVRHGFGVKSAARDMERNIKTVYGTRKELERVLHVSFRDGCDMARIVCAVHSHELGILTRRGASER